MSALGKVLAGVAVGSAFGFAAGYWSASEPKKPAPVMDVAAEPSPERPRGSSQDFSEPAATEVEEPVPVEGEGFDAVAGDAAAADGSASAQDGAVILEAEVIQVAPVTEFVDFDGLGREEKIVYLTQQLIAASEFSNYEDWEREVSSAIRELARLDPQAAIAFAEAETAALAREVLMEAALEGWVDEDPAGALTYVNELPPSRGERDMINDMLRVWAVDDLQGAAAFVSSMHPSYRQVEAVWSIAEAYGLTDPQVGAAWAATLPEGRQRQDAYETLALSWAEVDAQAATDFAESTVPHLASRVVERGAYTLALTDPQAALRFAESQEVHSQQAIQGAIDGWSDVDPAAAAEAIYDLSARDQNWAARNISGKWIRQDTPAAAAWVATLDERPRQYAMSQVAREYGAADPYGAMDWVDSLPQDGSHSRNMAVSMFSYNAWMVDPPEVLSRVETITNDGWRNQNLRNIARQWMEVDAASAKDWVSSSSLPDHYKQQLLGSDFVAGGHQRGRG
ncbi:MAG: hypothetical protein ACFB20_08305 [Opitutales bacterium]